MASEIIIILPNHLYPVLKHHKRLMKPASPQSRAHHVLAEVLVVIVAIATFLCMPGPFQ